MENKLLLDKRGKARKGTRVLWTVLGIIGVLVVIGLIFGLVGQRVAIDDRRVTPGVVPTTCPADLAYSGTVTIQNSLNTTAAEEYDAASMKFYAIENGQESFATSITDTTDGSVSLECGKEYVARVESGTNNHAYIVSAVMSGGKLSQSSGESIRFQVTGGSGNIKLMVGRHGDLQLRMFDRDENGFMYALTGTTGYNTTDGVNFTSTTDNATAKVVGTGETIRVTLYAQTQSQAREFNDLGVVFLVDADTSKWDVPSVSVDGKGLNVASLAGDEAIAYSSFEYAYAIPQDTKFSAPGEVQIAINLPALAGVDPDGSDAPAFALASKGHYVSVTDSTLLKVGSVKDDTSRTSVYTRWDVYMAIS